MDHGKKTKLIKIGNSKGIRIPKAMIDRLHLGEDVEVIVTNDHLEIRPGRKPREGWAEAFAEMAKHGDDQLLDEPISTQWDTEEWNW